MYVIKACPSCKKNLRFPINKGTINVKCGCGYSFIANPDNTELYKNAKFDLSGKQTNTRKFKFHKAFIKNNRILPNIANSILNFKYKLQNFKLLPDKEKFKVIFILLSILIILSALLIFIKALASSETTGSGNIII